MKRIIAILAIATVVGTSCNTSADKERDAALRAQQYTIDSIKSEMARKYIIDSMNAVAAVKAEEKAAATRSTARRSSTVRRSSAQGYTGYSNNGSTVYQPATSTQPINETPAETKKKGWSAKAKGAVIGAGAGAITGAAVSKDQKGKGAIIGGILGAGAGLGVGAIIDKKQGR
jgi:hypothetical protein